MNDGGDFRTAPATPGLLNKGEATKQLFSHWLIKSKQALDEKKHWG